MNSGNWYPGGVEVRTYKFCGAVLFVWACEKCHTPLQVIEGRGFWGCDCHPGAEKPWDKMTNEKFIERLHAQ